MNIAIYGRKSVFSEKSDSVDNQFRMCQEYAALHFRDDSIDFCFYSDEDFTGANTNRPDLQRMLHDMENGVFSVLVVYQLDRLSRDVKDFSNIYSTMEEHNVKFISIKENIDTSTPIGRAMMYVTVVFAQMERETIAARVTDNMIGLAKKGYWTGGNPPYGYLRQPIVVNGKRHVTIVPDPEGVEYNKWIFNTFLENNYSLQNMETYFRKNGIKTRSGKFFSTTQIYKILTMPYCVAATPEIYDFYEQKGCIMDSDSPRDKWDGKHGVMIYGRTTEKNHKHQLQTPDKWIVCIGNHDSFIPADMWLSVQKRLSGNKFNKKSKYDIPLLKGTIRCSCGSIMCVSRKKLSGGSVSSSYYCLRRMRQGADICDRAQIKIHLLDDKMMDIFKEIEHDPTIIHRYVPSVPISGSPVDTRSISKKITLCESKLERLVSAVALNSDSSAAKYMIAEMERLDLELGALKRELSAAKLQDQKDKLEEKSAYDKADSISSFVQNFDNFTVDERNHIVHDIVKECVWDGSTLSVIF